MIRNAACRLKIAFPACISRTFAAAAPFSNLGIATEVTVLPNGLRVASQTTHDETATVGVWVDAGSRYETEKNNGAAHFLEHLIFKGSRKFTRHGLEIEIENLGGHLNAYTSREQTAYFANVFRTDVGRAVEMISDILQHAKFEPRAVEAEKGVVVREMEEIDRMPEEVIMDLLHTAAYRNHGLGRVILGPQEVVEKMTSEDLKDYITTHYTPGRMVLAGAGAVVHEELVKLAEEMFEFPESVPEFKPPADSEKAFTPTEYRHLDHGIPQAHVALAFEGCDWLSEDAVPLLLINTLFGQFDLASGFSCSRLSSFAQIVTGMHLAHAFTTFNINYNETGLFGIYATTEPEMAGAVLDCFLAEIKKLPEISEGEVENAKTQLKAEIMRALDGTTAICEDIARQLLVYGRRLTPAEVFMRIDAITVETIRDVAARRLIGQPIATAGLGSIDMLPSRDMLQQRI